MLPHLEKAFGSFFLAITLATAAQSSGSDVSVDLGVEVAVRGEEVRLPLILNSKDGSVVSTISQVTFSSKVFSFLKAEPGSAVGKDRAEISFAVRPGENKEDSVVEVRIKSRSDPTLPNGSLAVLVFKLSDTAPPGDVTLKNSARVVMDKSQEMVVKGSNGIVTILDEAPPVSACFFYMH